MSVEGTAEALDPEATDPEVAGLRVIKRYANRKLYDTAARTFTTVAQVQQLVAAGAAVVVRDHASGADRTSEVLAQNPLRRAGVAAGALATAAARDGAAVAGPAGALSLVGGLLRTPGALIREVMPAPAAAEPVAAEPAAPEPDAREPEDATAAELRALREQVAELTRTVQALVGTSTSTSTSTDDRRDV